MRKILLTNSDKFAIVDDEDFEIIQECRWVVNNTGYAWVSSSTNPLFKKHNLMHRVVMGITGDNNVILDHINGNRLDNRKENLRVATRSQNTANSKKPSTNTSGYKGVSFASGSLPSWKKNWRAYITVNGKRKSLGYFATPEEAARAYDQAAKKYFEDCARLNFPENA